MAPILLSAAFLMLMAGSSPLTEGMWGGTGIQMTVDPKGAVLDLDCAHGAIEGPIAVGSDGRFRASGTYAVEHAGPVREEDENGGRPAVYEGRVEGKKLTLVITLADGKEAGTFELAHGRAGRVRKCM